MQVTPPTPESILIVEDDPVTRLALVKVLTKSGYHTLTAKNGREAVSHYIQYRPQLLLMDINMPVMNGFDAVQVLRNYETERSVPILMMTDNNDTESIDKAYESGATDFITKPINWTLLSHRIRYFLRASKTESKLRNIESHLTKAQKLAKLGYWEWDIINDKVTGSETAFEIFGTPVNENTNFDQLLTHVNLNDRALIHQAISDLSQGQTSVQIRFQVTHPDKTIVHADCLAEANYDERGNIIMVSGTVQDMSRLHKAEYLNQYQAEYDVLTDLPNRTHFYQTVQHELDSNSDDAKSAVIVIDIDRFKQINENLGQKQGDTILMALAKRLNRITREQDYVARLGNDEFVAFLQDLESNDDLTILINRFIRQLTAPFTLNSTDQYLTYSLGISIYPDDDTHAETVINYASIAMNKAKNAGGSQYKFYQSNMNQNALEMLSLENDLRTAVSNRELEVYFQPQVDCITKQPTGAEALIRWNHPSKGTISPAVFISMAESTGLIDEIGDFVLEKAIQTAEGWHESGHLLNIGINLSVRQLAQKTLIENVQRLISDIHFPARYIDLEITESLAMTNAESNKNTLLSLKALGVSLSIDDFGTGYSSLAYLHRFPIDTLKVDRSFVVNLDTKSGTAIANTILAMAQSLDLNVIAEGIENEAQAHFFRGKHCHVFQGNYFGLPMREKDFSEWLKTYNINN